MFTNAAPPAQIGDLVRAIGTVGEFRPGGDPDNLTITQINASNANVTTLSTGNRAPRADGARRSADACRRPR